MPDGPVAVVLAAGVGARVGAELPKQFLDLHGVPVLARTVRGLGWCPRIVVVHHPDHAERTRRVLEQVQPSGTLTLVPGGSTRRVSVSAALDALADAADSTALVLQNAASPNTPRALVERCLEGLATHDVVQAYLPAVQTVFSHEDGELVEVLPRAGLGCSTDPTVYRLGCLRRISVAQGAETGAGEMTLDTARSLGIAVRLVPSPESNVKLTTRSDLAVLRAALDPSAPA